MMSDEGRRIGPSFSKYRVPITLEQISALRRMSQLTRVNLTVLVGEAIEDFLHRHSGAVSAAEINESRLKARRERTEQQLDLFKRPSRVVPPKKYFDD